ncbi:hypothetical protein G3I76_47630, partial [Streptomyces sp. SID11233]|nr:hypothetical protein [Streptomyces sp. SID11233]
LRGAIQSGTGSAHTVFDHWTAPEYLGRVGTANTGQMDTIRFENGSRLAVDPASYFGRNWHVNAGNRIDIKGPATMSTVSFTDAGTVRLNSPESPDQLHSTVGNDWYSDGGTLTMSASTD